MISTSKNSISFDWPRQDIRGHPPLTKVAVDIWLTLMEADGPIRFYYDNKFPLSSFSKYSFIKQVTNRMVEVRPPRMSESH